MKKTAAELIADPLYQTNLVLWMLQPSTGVPIDPILQKAGYRLRNIEPPLPLPLELANKLIEDGIAVSNPVTPEVLVENDHKELDLIECKATMFGSQPQEGKGDSQIRQARSLLLQIPPILASALGLQTGDVSRTHLLYVSRHDPKIDQTGGLSEISQELTRKKYRTSSFGLLTLVAAKDGVAIQKAGGAGTLPTKLAAQLGSSSVIVHESKDKDTDPRPLYLLPWMPGSEASEDEYSHAAFGNRVLLAAVALVGPLKTPCDVEFDIDAILGSATQEHYGKWRDKDVRRRLQDNARNLLKTQIQRALSGTTVSPLPQPRKGLKLTLSDDAAKNRLIEGFRKWQAEHWNKPVEASLFDTLKDDE